LLDVPFSQTFFASDFLDPGKKAFVEVLLLNLQHGDIKALPSPQPERCRPHKAAAQYANFVDFHTPSEFISGNPVPATFGWLSMRGASRGEGVE